MDIDERVARVEAELAVRNLIADYALGLDTGDAERFMSVWSREATWVNGGTPYSGREAIRTEVERQWGRRSLVHHWTTNSSVSVDVEAGRAVALSDVHVRAVDAGGAGSHVGGRYRDSFVREDGAWRMSRREVDVTFRVAD